GAILALGACKTDSSKQDTASALNRDTSALGRDLAMANRDTTAQPQLKDVPANPPATSAPSRTTTTTRTPARTSTSSRETSGSTVTLTVTSLKRSENQNDNIVMEFAVNSVSFGGKTYPLDASVENANITRVRNEPKSKDAQKVAIGAGIGAIAGQILGKNTKS